MKNLYEMLFIYRKYQYMLETENCLPSDVRV